MSTKAKRVTDVDLRRVGARRRVAAFREQQAIVDAALSGWKQNRIAEFLEVSQPHISRTLASVKRQNGGALREVPTSVLELIDERDAGEISDAEMMQALKDVDYTVGYVPDVDGVATDAYVRGSWDDIEFAFQRDRLTFEEYSELFSARRDQQQRAAFDSE